MSADSARAKEDADPTRTFGNRANELIRARDSHSRAADAGALGDGDEASATAPRYYDWRRVCPELEVFLDSYDDLAAEMRAATNWKDWPETNLYGSAYEPGKGGHRTRPLPSPAAAHAGPPLLNGAASHRGL